MKIIKTLFIWIIAIVFLVLAGLFVFLKTFDLNRYLPEITKAASAAMKKEVRIARADATLSLNGAAVDVKDITIADQGQAPIIHIASLRIVPDLDAAFSRKKAKATIFVASGTVDVDAGPLSEIKEGRINLHAKVNDLKIEEILSPGAIPVKVRGRILGALDVLVNKADIKGSGEFFVEGGLIEQMNIIKATLGSALGAVPGLAESVDAFLMESLKTRIGGDNTVLEKVMVKFTMEDQTIFIDEALATTAAFEVNAKGTVGFDMKTKMHARAFVAEDVSTALLGKIDQLAFLADESGRMKVEGELSGVVPDLKFTPSIKAKEILKGTVVSEGMKQLDKAIEKNPELEPAKQLINDVLNSIFK